MVTQYCLHPAQGKRGPSYWVLASSADEARELIALNAGASAADPKEFECIPDDRHQLGPVVIVTNGGLTIPILKRQR